MAETLNHKESSGNRGQVANSTGWTESAGARRLFRRLAVAFVVLVIFLFAGVRWRLREMPLERDEGEYAYAGQLILEGIPPYELAYNMKLPGTYLAYAAIMNTFGQTPEGIHGGLLLINGCTTLLVFFLGRRLYGVLAATTAAMSYALLSTSEAVLGLAGHATHFVVIFAVAGLLFLLWARDSKSLAAYSAAGLCMGLGFLMKQPGIVFVIFGAQEVVWAGRSSRKRKLRARLIAYFTAAAIPYLLTCAALYRAGVFEKFWFWTVTYASQYATSTGIAEGWKYLTAIVPQLFFGAPVVWCFAAMGLLAMFLERGPIAALGSNVSLLIWSFLGASAGLYFRDHYFILLLPAVCLLAGKAMNWIVEQLKGRVRMNRLALTALGMAVFALGWAQAVYAQRAIFFEMNPEQVVRRVYGGNPFPETLEFSRYIQEHSDVDAQVGVLGSEPEIYFYSRRHSSTGYIYTYGLMEEQKFASRMQQEMISEIENRKPQYLVKVMIPGSWLRKPNSDTAILLWADRYISDHYRIVGVADVGTATTYRWDTAAEGYRPLSKYSMYLYKRKL
jgi:Dolichyl-phosphate-mannose-protein mannosyltransferase